LSVAVPKKKKSRARRDRRRANHDRVAAPTLSNCPECGAPTPPHQACASCGMYRGRQVVDVEDELDGAES
jgi:large subunit ribosomal protein L32